MSDVPTVFLGATYSRPAVELLTTAGDRLPLSLGTDDMYASDYALGRVGWVAIMVGEQVVALRDGEPLHPTRLPDGWSVAPASDPALLLIRRDFGRSMEEDEPETVGLVDMFGSTLKSVTAHVSGVFGELKSGLIVTQNALLGWDGTISPLPAGGTAIATVAGRFIVLDDGDVTRVFDTEKGTERIVPRRGVNAWGAVYDSEATRVTFRYYEHDYTLVVTDSGEPCNILVGSGTKELVWVNSYHLLTSEKNASRLIDIRTGIASSYEGLPQRSSPHVEVTGRFNLEELRALDGPSRTGRISQDLQDELLESAEARVRSAAEAAGMSAEALLENCLPAVRLRSFRALSDIPVGASHFGGRPDLPARTAWPRSPDGVPKSFLLQLRCDEIDAVAPETDFWDDMLLMVFVRLDLFDKVSVYLSPSSGIQRTPWPEDLDEEFRLDVALASIIRSRWVVAGGSRFCVSSC